jgi:glycerate dehydrogenase
VVRLEGDSFPAHVRFRAPSFAHRWTEFARTAPAEVAGRIADATIAIVNKVAVDARALEGAPRLGLVAVSATGTDMVDKDWCVAHGITVTNVQGYAAQTVAEHVFCLVLALRRNLVGFLDDVARGEWASAPGFCLFTHAIGDLAGKRLGVIGHGAIGEAVARIGRGFSMDVLIAEQRGAAGVRRGRAAFDEVLRSSDVLTLHCPLTPATRGLIGEGELERMQRGAILVNAARGGIVDEQALAKALARGWIGGAAFDVASREPMPAEHPLAALVGRPDFLLTPHVAWASDEAMGRLAEQSVRCLEAYVAGTPINVVVDGRAGRS